MQKERETSPIFAHANTHEFLVEAIEEGAIEKTLDMYRDATSLQDRKFRNLNILAIYLGSDASSQEIADIYPEIKDRRTIPNIVRKTLNDIWSLSSEDLRSRYPLESLEAAKPLSIKSRIKMSQARSGLTLKIYELIGEGSSYENIITQTGATPEKLTKVRPVLKRWGAEIPHRKTKIERLIDVLNSSESDSEIQKVLDLINDRFYKVHLNLETPVVLPVYKVARLSGFYLRQDRLPEFLDSLRRAQIPLGEWKPRQKDVQVTYYLIAAKHLQRAQEAFRKDPNLTKYLDNPVKLAFGPEGEIPTSADLFHSKKYLRPGYIFRQLGIKVGVRGKRYADFFNEACPVRIYRHSHSFYFLQEDEILFRNYVTSRAKELGFIPLREKPSA